MSVRTESSAASLREAAKILVLMARNRDPRYGKAATRWMSRYRDDTESSPRLLAELADNLAQLGRGDVHAGERLLEAIRTKS